MAPPTITGRLAVRNMFSSYRTIINRSAPWLPWVVPSAIGAFDAVDIIGKPATPLYVGLIVAAATVTVITQVPRLICRALSQRWESAAEQAPVGEAALLIYQLASEHLEARRAVSGEFPHVVGGEDTAPLPSLHIVRTPVAAEVGHDAVFRRAANIGRAAVPQQAGRPAQVAAARRLRPDA